MRLPQIIFSDPVKGAFIFAFAGPLLGTLVVTMAMAVPWVFLMLSKDNFMMAVAALLIPPLAAGLSLPFGAIPAAMAGFVIGCLRTKLNPVLGALASGLIAVLTTLFFFTFLMLPPGPIDIHDSLKEVQQPLMLFSAFAFVGGSIVGYAFLRWPNRSVRPTSLRQSA